MKLQCEIKVVNRFHSSSEYVLSCGKYLKSTLAIGGRNVKKGNEYFIILFSSDNKSGTKYRVKTVKQVFVKYLAVGKATIRLEEPPHDLCIKSESVQLKCFMRLLKKRLTGYTKISQLPALCAPTKGQSEFSKSLPQTLSLADLKPSDFRRNILLFKHLVYLDLSNIGIRELPAEFGRLLNLSELYLANNLLGVIGELDWRWLLGPQLTKSLKLLDMSGNKLGSLPTAIWKLQRLVTLKLDNNMLRNLPDTLGRISSLRYLTISQNCLQYLPCSLTKCRLEILDIRANQFNQQSKSELFQYNILGFYIGRLLQLSARVVLKHKLYYAPNTIPQTLVSFLDDTVMCVCGAPVLNNAVYMLKQWELKDYFRTVVFDNNSSIVGFMCYFCSRKCYEMYDMLCGLERWCRFLNERS